MSLSLQFLGTGTSVGVPQIGCSCPVCTSTDARDRRRRSGVYVRAGETAFVIDTPPEFREACLAYGVVKVDACVLTHAHMDHVAAFDDLRRFNTLNGKTVMTCYAAPETVEAMRHIFPYITTKPGAGGLFRPMIAFRPVRRAFRIGAVRVTPLPVAHGGTRTNGYLLEADGARAAYISDCAGIPAATRRKIRGVDLLVLDCLREREHPTHFNLEKALAAARAVAPRRTLFTHMSHSVSHAAFEARLPADVRLAYDGLTVTVEGGETA